MSAEAPLLVSDLYDASGVSLYLPKPSVQKPNSFSSLRRLRLGSVDDLKTIVNPDARLEDCSTWRERLREYIRLTWGPNRTPIYIVDYHQAALFGWSEALKEGRIKPGARLRHYDDHADAGSAKLEVIIKESLQRNEWDLGEIAKYIRILKCYEFIEPAIRMGLVDKLIHIFPGNVPTRELGQIGRNGAYLVYRTVSMGFYCNNPHLFDGGSNDIVDIDLDYFADTQVNVRSDMEVMRKDMELAGVVTLATSPGFIEQRRAVELIKRLLS